MAVSSLDRGKGWVWLDGREYAVGLGAASDYYGQGGKRYAYA